MFGLVGIEVDIQKKTAFVGLARQWKRDDMNSIPSDVAKYFQKVKWDMTFADQQIGQHMVRAIEKSLGFQVTTITTQKNLKDPENIELIKVMDMTEMTQLTLALKQKHKIQFPPVDELTNHMEQLTKQIEMFTEHVTEQGTVSYYAPGEELDCLPRALMICLFAARTSLTDTDLTFIIKQGTGTQQTPEESFDNFFSNVLGDDYQGMGENYLNTTNKFRVFERTKRQW